MNPVKKALLDPASSCTTPIRGLSWSSGEIIATKHFFPLMRVSRSWCHMGCQKDVAHASEKKVIVQCELIHILAFKELGQMCWIFFNLHDQLIIDKIYDEWVSQITMEYDPPLTTWVVEHVELLIGKTNTPFNFIYIYALTPCLPSNTKSIVHIPIIT